MGAHSSGRRALAGFFVVTPSVVLLFGAVALVALHPVDGLAWVQVPDLTADLRLDAGLQTKPLKTTVVAEALQDQALDASDAQALAIPPALAVAAPPATVAISLPPSSRPVTTPVPTAVAVPTPAPTPTATPSATPVTTPSPSPTPAPAATPSPTPTPAPTPTPTPSPAPTPTPKPSPTPTPTPTSRFAITSATENVSTSARTGNNAGRCNQTTVTATGSFTTNGVGGWVFYYWAHYDTSGKLVSSTPESPIRIAAGDTSSHAVVADSFRPQHSGSDKLVFLSPAYSATAQSWSCVG
jgi:outer membrane biosynthesis protein TonB